MDTRNNRGRNDYSIYEKAYLKKSKKILNRLEESRSKSHSKIAGSRSVSPVSGSVSGFKNSPHVHIQPHSNIVDTKKYVS